MPGAARGNWWQAARIFLRVPTVDEVLNAGFEGYVAKDEASPYVGGVTRSWLKVKVPGWTDPEDRWKRVRLGAP